MRYEAELLQKFIESQFNGVDLFGRKYPVKDDAEKLIIRRYPFIVY